MKAERKQSQGEGNARGLERTDSNGQAEMGSTTRPPISTVRTGSSQKLRSPDGQSGVESFPAVTEEDMNAYPSQEKDTVQDKAQVPSYDGAKEDLKDGSKVRGKDKSDLPDARKEGGHEVCQV